MRPVLALVWLASCAACAARREGAPGDDSAPPARGGTLEIVGSGDVDHLATTSGYVDYSMWLFRTFTRQLLAYPPSTRNAVKIRPAPDLALEVPTRENGGVSADGLSYTFRLRRGVRWDTSPPREVTAHDVVRAFKLFCNPMAPVGAPGYYTSTIAGMEQYCDRLTAVPPTVPAIRAFVTGQDLEGVTAPDDFTVLFRLRAPAVDFLNLVTMPFASPVPVEYLDDLPDSPEARQHTRSDGPYRITRYVQNGELLLERNPVWDPATDPLRPAHVDRIRVRLGIDAQLEQLQIEAGTADLSLGNWVPPAELASLLTLEDPGAWLSPEGELYGSFWFLAFNHVGPNNGGALRRRDVRLAIAAAVNRAALVRLRGGPRVARPLYQAVPSSGAGHEPGADRNVTPGDRGDPAAARAMLAEAGYPDAFSIRLAYQQTPEVALQAQALQASLGQAGLRVDLLPSTVGDLYGRLLSNPENARRGEWDLALVGWIPDWFDKNNGRSIMPPLFDGRRFGQGSSQNYGGYQRPEVDAAIDRALVAASPEAAAVAWTRVARLLVEDAALVPLFETKSAYARSRRVRNCTWSVFGLNCDLTSVWLAGAAPRSEAAP